jgi:hypothetical protein
MCAYLGPFGTARTALTHAMPVFQERIKKGVDIVITPERSHIVQQANTSDINNPLTERSSTQPRAPRSRGIATQHIDDEPKTTIT